jgi:quercetin dioxygenase-like cupin family protein
MMRFGLVISATLVCFLLTSAAIMNAQTKGGQPDPGVTPIRQIDRSEVRVTRVELEGGAVRSTHTHDDVRFHLFIPISGTFELKIGADKPVSAAPGQVFYMEKGTPHGFRNTGQTKATVMEVFVKGDGSAADGRHVIELVKSYRGAAD